MSCDSYDFFAHGVDLHRSSVILTLKIVFTIIGSDFRFSACPLVNNSSVQHDKARKPNSVVELTDDTASPPDMHRVGVIVISIYRSWMLTNDNMMGFDIVLAVLWTYIKHDTYLYERNNIPVLLSNYSRNQTHSCQFSNLLFSNVLSTQLIIHGSRALDYLTFVSQDQCSINEAPLLLPEIVQNETHASNENKFSFMLVVKKSPTGHQNIQVEANIADQPLCEEKKPSEVTGKEDQTNSMH